MIDFTAVPVPEVSRKVQPNPFIDAVQSLLPLDKNEKGGKGKGALTFTVNVNDTEKRGTKDVPLLARYERQLTEAGNKLGVTVRRVGQDAPDKDGNVTVKFWPVFKIERAGKADATEDTTEDATEDLSQYDEGEVYEDAHGEFTIEKGEKVYLEPESV